MTEKPVQEILGRTVDDFMDRGSGGVFTDTVFRSCVFEGCWWSLTDKPALRSKASRLSLIGCSVRGGGLGPGVLEDVTVDGLKTSGLFQARGLALRHVVLKGRIGRIMLTPVVGIHIHDEAARVLVQQSFDEANRTFYQSTDWALDISGGEFEECEIQGVPARLIRRDPTTQVVVRRDKVMQGEWRELDLSGTHWATSLDFLMSREEEDVVLVAGKRSKNFRRLLEGLEQLRKAGVAEWD